MSRKLIFFCLLLAGAFSGNSQSDTLYNVGVEDQFVSQEYIDHLLQQTQANRNKDSIGWEVSFKISHEKEKGDTLIRFGHLNIAERRILQEDEKMNLRLHQALPEFEFQTLEGKTLRSADLKGQVLLLNFWFTRCRPCIAEMPLLN